jgi:hypothetical protein
LTAFGEKLVWAGQRMQARLGPQLENLAQELATEIKPFLHQRPSVIRVHASHGFAVSKLRELLDREPGIGVDLRYVSNQNSLVSLDRGPAIFQACMCRAANCVRKPFSLAGNGSIHAKTASSAL